MRLRLFLPGQPTSGKNAIKINPRTFAHYAGDRFKIWRAAMVKAINAQLRPNPYFQPITDPVSLTVYYSAGDGIKRDISGIQDALYHVLELKDKDNKPIGILADDSQIKALTWVPVTAGNLPGLWLELETVVHYVAPPWMPEPEIVKMVAVYPKRKMKRKVTANASK